MRTPSHLALLIGLTSAGASSAGVSPRVERALAPVAKEYARLDLDRALERVHKAAQLSKGSDDDALCALYEGVVLSAMSRADESDEAFRKALRIHPDAKLPLTVSKKLQASFEALRAEATRPPPEPAPVPPPAAPAAPAPPRNPQGTRVAVFDFEANGAGPEVTTAATGAVAHQLDEMGAFAVVTADTVRHLLSLERQKELLGCSEGMSACLTEVVGAFGVEYVVAGKVSRLPGRPGEPPTLSLELTLLAVAQAKRVASTLATATSEAQLIDEARTATSRLMSSFLSAHPGFLSVRSNERGAAVKVDGLTVGTTPLAARLSVPPGAHVLEVTKDEFVAFKADVHVQPGQEQSLEALLVPNPDFVRAYASHQSKLRLGAWLCTGAAVAGAGVAGFFAFRSHQLYGDPNTPGTFQYAKARLVEGVEQDAMGDYRQIATTTKSQIQTANAAGYVAAGVGGAAAITAAVFWIVGDDPHRYDAFKVTGLGVAADGRGGVLTLGGQFP